MIMEGNRSYYDIQLAYELCGQKKKESEQAPDLLKDRLISSPNFSEENKTKRSPMTSESTSKPLNGREDNSLSSSV